MSEADLVSAANRNFADGYRVLVRHCPAGAIHETDGLFAFTSGLPIRVLNGCIVTGHVEAAALEDALGWLDAAGVPYYLWIDPGLGKPAAEAAPSTAAVVATLRDAATRHGLEEHESYPGMVLHPVRPAPEPAAGVEVIAVDPTDPAQVDEFTGTWEDDGIPRHVVEQLFSPGFIGDDSVRLFTGRLEGRRAGTSVAIRGGNLSGVVSVGTLPAARRRGVGTAVSWAAAAAGHAWGCDAVVLQATAMGFPVYRAMGFRTVVEYVTLQRRTS